VPMEWRTTCHRSCQRQCDDNQRADGPMARGLFKFVSPRPLVSKRFAFKELGIIRESARSTKSSADFPLRSTPLYRPSDIPVRLSP